MVSEEKVILFSTAMVGIPTGSAIVRLTIRLLTSLNNEKIIYKKP